MNGLDSTNSYIGFYLQKLRAGDSEAAFRALTEVGHSVIPRLIDAFRSEDSASVRAELVTIIWNHRRPETAGFLGEALNDQSPEVWQNALDGLVTLRSSQALEILNGALTRQLPTKRQTEEFQAWVREAIGQIQEGKSGP
jgi:hypothetical protein